jgi:hypothetical protein
MRIGIDQMMDFIFDVLEDGESSFCAACRNEVEEGEFVHALNQDWHLECFRFVSTEFVTKNVMDF